MAITIQLRRDVSSNWASADPVLAEGELGFETNTGFYKLGDGISNWNILPYYALREMNSASNIQLTAISNPEVPSAGKMNFFAKAIAGRMLPKAQGPSGLNFSLQLSFFQNNITMINTNATTSITSIGNSVTTTGTISHPNPVERYGLMANFISGSTTAATAGTGNSTLIWTRGATNGFSNGFFFNARLGFPDSDYNGTVASTGSRIFVGLTNQTMANSVASDNPAGHFVGFFRRHVGTGTQDTTWQLATKNNSSLNLLDTGCTFNADTVYDFFLFCPPAPNNSIIFWRVDNVITGESFEGSVATFLPDTNIWLRGGFQLQTINAVARNIRMQRVYIESDR